jgi:Zn-dependent protease with chaperone function
MTLRHWLSTSTALGIVAAVGLVLCALALQDIAHGEADVRNEWWAVRIGLSLMGLFIAAALLTLVKVRRAVGPGFLGPTGS